MTSQARIDANKKNAQRSTGPRTQAGKERTRLNGLKHGLRSEEIVLPTEDRAVYESHLAAWMDDWKPPTETRRFLVERVAAASWRLKRCVRNETARLGERARRAGAEWDKIQDDHRDRQVKRLPEEPEAALAELLATRRGTLRVMEMLQGLSHALMDPAGWSDFEPHHNRLCHLLGISGEGDPPHLERISEMSFRVLLWTSPELADDDTPPIDDATATALRQNLRSVCNGRLKEYDAHYDALPSQVADRDAYAERRAMEPHPEDTAYHRYEGRLDREARASIAQLIRLEQTGLDLIAGDEPEAPSEPIAPIRRPERARAPSSLRPDRVRLLPPRPRRRANPMGSRVRG